MKELADTHVAPPLRRWLVRLGLAVVVAIVIGYVPGQLLSRDPRAEKLSIQLQDLQADARAIAAGNVTLSREVQALHSDVSAIEDRARADLGMVYPDEVILRVHRTEPLEQPAPKTRAAQGLAR